MTTTAVETTVAVETTTTKTRRPGRVAGWVVTVFITLFLLSDSVGKLIPLAVVRSSTEVLGFQPHHLRVIGAVLLVCVVLYLIPRTAVLGAVLLVGYLGGATAAQMRIDSPAFPQSFPIICGVLVWLGLWLREPAVRALLPFRR